MDIYSEIVQDSDLLIIEYLLRFPPSQRTVSLLQPRCYLQEENKYPQTSESICRHRRAKKSQMKSLSIPFHLPMPYPLLIPLLPHQ